MSGGGPEDVEPMTEMPLPRVGDATILDRVDRSTWSGLTLAPRVAGPFDPSAGHAIIEAALADGALVTAAVQDSTVVGLVIVERPGGELVALGVAPAYRRAGLASRLLVAERARAAEAATRVEITMAERDVVEPLDRSQRASVARRLFEGAGFRVVPPESQLQSLDAMLLALER